MTYCCRFGRDAEHRPGRVSGQRGAGGGRAGGGSLAGPHAVSRGRGRVGDAGPDHLHRHATREFRPSVSSASQLLRELFLGCQTLSAIVGLIKSAEAVGVRSVLAEFLRVSTRLRVLQFTVTRLSDPYGGCVDITSRNKSRNVYEEVYGVKYRCAWLTNSSRMFSSVPTDNS